MSSAKVQDSSQKLSTHLTTLLQSRGPCTVGLFYPIQNEPDLMRLAHSPLLNGWKWALPVCQGDGKDAFLEFSEYKPSDQLKPGRYGIPVPEVDRWVEPQFILIPCLGFNRRGFRLGYGQGWYDRTLSRLSSKPQTAGAAWEESLIEENFQDDWDVPLDWIVTEMGIQVGPV